MKSVGTCRRRPRKSPTWLEAMITAIPAVKPVTTGMAGDDQDRARHQGCEDQARIAVHGDDSGDDHDERTGRPADLHPRAAQRRNEEAGDDRRDQALAWARA